MSGSNDFSDLSMLDLFKIELENHTKLLEVGLVDLEADQSPQKIEPLMRAAHSIKGAARIIRLDIAVSLAHAMEDVLSSLQKGDSQISSEHIDLLLKGNDYFISLSKLEVNSISEKLKNDKEKIESLSSDVRSLLMLKPKIKSLTKKEIKKTSPKTSKKVHLNIDPIMFDLFKSEVVNNTAIIFDQLQDSEDSLLPERIIALFKSTKSIKGASKIVGIEIVSEITDRIEIIFNLVLNNTLKLDKEKIKILIDAINYINELKNCEIATVYDYLNSNIEKSNTIVESLSQLIETKPLHKLKDEIQSSPKDEELTEQVKTKESKVKKTDDAFVRIHSKNLNKLLGLAGESLVQAKSIKTFSKSLHQIKTINKELFRKLEEIYNSDKDEPELEAECIKILNASNNLLLQKIEEYEQFSRTLEILSDKLYSEVVSSKMRPFSDGLHGYPRMIRDLAKKMEKKVKFDIIGENTLVDREILEKLEAPLTHLLRNSIDHGLENPEERKLMGKPEEGILTLEAQHRAGMLNISVKDDGKGIDLEKLRKKVIEKNYVSNEMAQALSNNELLDFLFLPGFTTTDKVTEVSGRGVGLDVVHSTIQEVRGSVRVDTKINQGSVFTLILPITLSVLRTLLIKLGGEIYALPLTRIDRIVKVKQDELKIIEDRQFCIVDDENIGVVDGNQLIQKSVSHQIDIDYSIIVISDRMNRYGIVIEELLGQSELVVIPLDSRLGKIPNIHAGAILEDGKPILILEVDDLIRNIDSILLHSKPSKITQKESKAKTEKKKILVVDDSLTVREVERKLLENSGYNVIVAVDGIDGWNLIQGNTFDLIITDVDMPRMNGIELVYKIKTDVRYKEIPIMIVSYKDREEDKIKGLQAGANYYLTKSSFHDESLIEAVRDMIGEPA
jgi:two-component system sensor histidine kinase and response regulator WspE